MDKLKMQTANKADENFKKLAAMFPNAVTETINENGEVVRAIDKDVLMQEPIVQEIRKLQLRSNIAIFNVGNISTGKSMGMVRQGYISEFQMKKMVNDGAVANIINHFVGRNGEVYGGEIEERNMALELEYLRQKEYRIVPAAGREKIEAVQAALNGGYINVLIIDENIAKGILR